jgi:glutathione S-transferase
MSVLHGAALSPFVRKVRAAFIEKGIAYELDPVFPFNPTPEYLAMSPLGKIPCYTTPEGQHIPDSSVIIAYLERVHPENSLYPSDAGDLARALFAEEYGDSVVVAACGTVFFQRIVGPMFMDQPTDEAAVKNALEVEIPKVLDWLDAQVAGKKFFVGDSLSVADIAICSPFVNLAHGQGDFDRAKYKNFATYLEGILARDSFAGLIKEEKAAFAQAA